MEWGAAFGAFLGIPVLGSLVCSALLLVSRDGQRIVAFTFGVALLAAATAFIGPGVWSLLVLFGGPWLMFAVLGRALWCSLEREQQLPLNSGPFQVDESASPPAFLSSAHSEVGTDFITSVHAFIFAHGRVWLVRLFWLACVAGAVITLLWS